MGIMKGINASCNQKPTKIPFKGVSLTQMSGGCKTTVGHMDCSGLELGVFWILGRVTTPYFFRLPQVYGRYPLIHPSHQTLSRNNGLLGDESCGRIDC